MARFLLLCACNDDISYLRAFLPSIPFTLEENVLVIVTPRYLNVSLRLTRYQTGKVIIVVFRNQRLDKVHIQTGIPASQDQQPQPSGMQRLY